MIPYSRDPRQVIPASSVKIIGLGGAGANMLERIALDGMEGAELLALNTDIRTLGACLAKEKIQLGVNLTKGLGTGGDPELGHQAVLEAEDSIRDAIRGSRIVFLCTGLGGGTGSGASPIVTRIAREEGAFVVVFATMPFAFEGRRRREQAETALNELAVLSNALVTFDNNRMGELVLAKQGIHEAFIAADHMICESIKAVIRLVIRPGLINVGLDDLMSALRTTRSRCLFGSGMASGKDRASKALRNALASPLLDQGSLLKEAQTVLVHLCGGEDLTLFEIELLMQRLQKFVPEQAHVLFGAAIDPAMGDSLSLTLISALPEDSLAMAPRESLSQVGEDHPLMDPSQGFSRPAAAPSPAAPVATPVAKEVERRPQAAAPVDPVRQAPARDPLDDELEPAPEPKRPGGGIPPRQEPRGISIGSKTTPSAKAVVETPAAKPPEEAPPATALSRFRRSLAAAAAGGLSAPEKQESPPPELFDDDRPFAEPETPPAARAETKEIPELDAFSFEDDAPAKPESSASPASSGTAAAVADFVTAAKQPAADSYGPADPDPSPIEDTGDFSGPAAPSDPDLEAAGFSPIPRKRPSGVPPWTSKGGKTASIAPELDDEEALAADLEDDLDTAADTNAPAAAGAAAEAPRLKLGIKSAAPQSELSLDSAPRGRFEGENPNVFDGEDLDLPPFLRKKK
jgi:cell division protein FtsZ